MKATVDRLFLEHPRTVNESYFEHQIFALRFAWRLFKASLAAFVHALIPRCCEKTASKAIMEMHQKLVSR